MFNLYLIIENYLETCILKRILITRDKKMKKRTKLLTGILLITAIAIIVLITQTGFFVYEPIGDLPEGGTIWYWRNGLDIDFISSADGMLIKEGIAFSFLSRPIMLIKTLEVIDGRDIANFPYSDFLFRYSTREKSDT